MIERQVHMREEQVPAQKGEKKDKNVKNIPGARDASEEIERRENLKLSIASHILALPFTLQTILHLGATFRCFRLNVSFGRQFATTLPSSISGSLNPIYFHSLLCVPSLPYASSCSGLIPV